MDAPTDGVFTGEHMGALVLWQLYRGLAFEMRHPGMRLTRKAPKCSTILRQRYGIRGRPMAQLAALKHLMIAMGIYTEAWADATQSAFYGGIL